MHHCTAKHRDIAHGKGIMHLNDVSCPGDLGHNSTSEAGKQIKKYIDGRWNNISDIPLPVTLTDRSPVLYLDFESCPIGSVDFKGASTYVNEWIYLAGVMDQNGEVSQFGYTDTNDSTKQTEQNIAKGLYELFNLTAEKYGDFHIVSWSDAEARYLYKLEDKFPQYPIGSLYAYRLLDLHETFVTNKIVLAQQTDDKLQTVARVMNIRTKTPIDTSSIMLNVVNNTDLTVSKRKELLKCVLSYNLTDIIILKDMVEKIHAAHSDNSEQTQASAQ
jgi:hypothetical protein